MLKDTEERVSRQNADASRKINELSEEIQKVTEQNRNEQSAFVMKMHNDSNDMQTRMSELQRELQAVKNMTAVYERAEQIKKQLDDKISELNDDFVRLEDFKAAAANINSQYNDIIKIKTEIDRGLDGYEEQQRRMDDVGSKYEKAISSSNIIEEKIRGLYATFDELQNMELRIRDFKESLAGISGRYDRLEQKNEVIDRVCKDIDTSFENLKTIEDRLNDCSRQTEKLPDEIRGIQRNVDALMKNGPKIGEAAEKLGNLQHVLDETEKRMEEITSVNKGLGRSEQRLAELNTQIESRFKQLALLSERDAGKNHPREESHINPQERELVRQLKLQGWTIPAIASRLKRSQAEVELLLELPIE